MEIRMAREHTEGNVDKATGKVKEGLGKASGDRQMEEEGKGDQAKGDVKKGLGSIKDAIKNITRR